MEAAVCGLMRAIGRDPPSLHWGQYLLEPGWANPEQSGVYQERMLLSGETSSQPHKNLQRVPRTHCSKSPTISKQETQQHSSRPSEQGTSWPKSLTMLKYPLRYLEIKANIYERKVDLISSKGITMGLLIFKKKSYILKRKISISQETSFQILGPWESSQQFWSKKKKKKKRNLKRRGFSCRHTRK